jgi:hypothetical protein
MTAAPGRNVVNLVAVRDGSDEHLVSDAMNLLAPAVDLDLPITLLAVRP